jgi:hypothetical protein
MHGAEDEWRPYIDGGDTPPASGRSSWHAVCERRLSAVSGCALSAWGRTDVRTTNRRRHPHVDGGGGETFGEAHGQQAAFRRRSSRATTPGLCAGRSPGAKEVLRDKRRPLVFALGEAQGQRTRYARARRPAGRTAPRCDGVCLRPLLDWISRCRRASPRRDPPGYPRRSTRS